MNHYFTNNEDLKENIQKVEVDINGIKYYFYTDNGVFSKGELDFGTELLLKMFKYDRTEDKKALDIGCGCGPIGLYLSKLGFSVDMTDINLRAINLSKRALEEQSMEAKVFESDAYTNINDKYDYILSNPPIRVGKEKLYEILMNAKNYLNKDGEFWIVVRKKQGAESIIKDMSNVYNSVQVIHKKKGFYILKIK